MVAIIAFFLKHKNLSIYGILFSILLASAAYVGMLRKDVTTVTAEKIALQVKLSLSDASVKSLQDAINEQNIAIDKLKAQADQREAKHRDAINKARITSAEAKKRADDLLNSIIPLGKTACEASDNLFNQEIKSAK